MSVIPAHGEQKQNDHEFGGQPGLHHEGQSLRKKGKREVEREGEGRKGMKMRKRKQ